MVKKKKNTFLKKLIYAFLLSLTGILLFGVYQAYHKIYQPNVILKKGKSAYFYIRSQANIHDVTNSLYEQGFIQNRNTFEWLLEKKEYKNHIQPGRYLIKNGMSNNKLISLLLEGKHDPVHIKPKKIKTKNQIAGLFASQLETDSSDIMKLLNDSNFTSKYGFNTHSILTLFFPIQYTFNWSVSAEGLISEIAKTYKKIWTSERKKLARNIGFSQSEITIIASIVQAEQSIRRKEQPKVAGLYINRLNKDMALESDPTIIYALKNFNIKRVLNKDRKVKSPYNTYKNKGLPPGPINLPRVETIDAVLNHSKHDFIFMCAKEDFSGYHNFSKTYREHKVFAKRYQEALNKRKIYR